MQIITTTSLSSNQFNDAKILIELCRLADQTKGVSFFENEINAIKDFPCFYLMYQGNILVSFVSVFVPDNEECEVYAHTLPKFRRQGHFRKLFEMVREQAKKYGISKMYFINEPSSYAGAEALKRLGASYESSEYLMSYNMRIKPKPQGILQFETAQEGEENELHTTRNGVRIGTVKYLMDEDIATLYGVEVAPEYRGRGFGVETILLTVEYLIKKGCQKIILHVSGNNKAAYHLYFHHGFVHVEQLDYWMLRVI